MGYGDYYWGFSRDYYRDPFPHSYEEPDSVWSRVPLYFDLNLHEGPNTALRKQPV